MFALPLIDVAQKHGVLLHEDAGAMGRLWLHMPLRAGTGLFSLGFHLYRLFPSHLYAPFHLLISISHLVYLICLVPF